MKRMIGIMIAILLLSSFGSRSEEYLWPAPGVRSLSSTFGEYRAGHFHAGIDIRSFGKRGLPCFAIGSGYVERVKVRPSGYGSALYLRLDDGATAVYAHLYGFSARLDSLTYNEMKSEGECWCDIYPPKDEYRFDTGDTVCFSGRTGTVFPHLHFEMRDTAGRPFNPLLGTYSVPDDEAPFISGLEITPLAEGSVVEGSFQPVVELFQTSGRSSFAVKDTIQMAGSFGFGVSAWDEQKLGTYKMGPFSIQLFVDGYPVYTLENRSFSYEQSDEIVFEYNDYGDGWLNRYRTLFRVRGNSLGGREGPGVISADSSRTGFHALEKGLHEGEIMVSDAMGNSSSGYFTFMLHEFPVIDTVDKLENAFEAVVSGRDPDGGEVVEKVFESLDGGRNWNEVQVGEYGEYRRAELTRADDAVYKLTVSDDEGAVVSRHFASPSPKAKEDMVFCQCEPVILKGGIGVRVKTDRILASLPDVVNVSRGGSGPEELVELGEGIYMARFGFENIASGVNVFRISGTDYRGYPLEEYEAFRILLLKSGVENTCRVSDSLTIRLNSKSTNGIAPCLVKPATMSSGYRPGKKMVSFPFILEFPNDLFLEKLTISGPEVENIGLFRFDSSDSTWGCVGVPSMEGGTVTLTEGGTYAFFTDGFPPMLGPVKSSREPEGSGFFKPFIYYVPVEDTGCGVDPYSSDVFWNGEWVVSHWDQIKGNLYIPVPSNVPAGMVKLRVEIADRAGNRSVEEFGFMLK